MDANKLALDRMQQQQQDSVIMVIGLQFHKRKGIYWPAQWLSTSQ